MLYRVKGIDILHNGERYPEGSEVELSDKEAKALARWIEPVKETTPEGDDPAGGGATTAGEPADAMSRGGQVEGTRSLSLAGVNLTERDSQILEAMKKVLAQGKTTKDGRPQVEAIEEVVGFNISAEERDRLYKILKGGN